MLDFKTLYSNYLVYFKASNAFVSSDFAPTDDSLGTHLIDISIEPVPIDPFIPNFEPEFVEDLKKVEISLNSSENVVYKLPKLIDLNEKDTHTLEIKNSRFHKYLSLQ